MQLIFSPFGGDGEEQCVSTFLWEGASDVAQGKTGVSLKSSLGLTLVISVTCGDPPEPLESLNTTSFTGRYLFDPHSDPLGISLFGPSS